MQKWMAEDWEFEIRVTEGEARNCRLGIEQGDTFVFQYGCPADFCPRAMIELFTWCEVIRCGGDFTHRGCPEPYRMELKCPCGCITFALTAKPIHRDEHGVYNGISKQPPCRDS